jgi:hypothetical protein
MEDYRLLETSQFISDFILATIGLRTILGIRFCHRKLRLQLALQERKRMPDSGQRLAQELRLHL